MIGFFLFGVAVFLISFSCLVGGGPAANEDSYSTLGVCEINATPIYRTDDSTLETSRVLLRLGLVLTPYTRNGKHERATPYSERAGAGSYCVQ